MFVNASDISRKKAKSAHELYLINILFFHLLLTPASIALDIGYYGLLLPLLFSSMVISYIYLQGKRLDDWFIMVHWKLSFRRCRLLMIGYALSLAIFAVGFLISLGIEKESMQHIMLTVFTRIAIMPTLIMVMITAVIEAGSINQAVNGEVLDKLVRDFPPPDSIEVKQE